MDERLGRYQLVRRVGETDLSDAYVALQHGDGGFLRTVVVKRLKPTLVADGPSLRAFQGEAHLLTRLRHRSIPHVYDLQRDGHTGAWFIALEYMPGPSLKAVMETERLRDTPLPLALALSVASQLCAAVHHVHEATDTRGEPAEVVHRNLAPANVVLGRDGVTRIVDFGCAVPRAELDATGSDGRGTAGYMAPEQILAHEPPDRRADVFVLGILLYEMTTGARLYEGHGERLRRALMDTDAPPARQQRAAFPAALEEILTGALARDPARRPASADVLMRQIEGFAAAQRIQLGTARVASYLSEAFPPEPEPKADEAALVAPHTMPPSTRSSAPPTARTNALPSSAPSRRKSVPPATRGSAPPSVRAAGIPSEPNTDLDGIPLGVLTQDAPSESEAEDTMVGQSRLPRSLSTRPSSTPERTSVGMYIHVGAPSDDLEKKR